MIYVDINGQRFEAATCEELVSQLRESSFEKSESDEKFMEESAERAKIQSGIDLDTTSVAGFVASMINGGLLKEMNEDMEKIKENDIIEEEEDARD